MDLSFAETCWPLLLPPRAKTHRVMETAELSMVCPQCQTENPDHAVFCMKCAGRLAAPDAAVPTVAMTSPIPAGATPATAFMARPAPALVPGTVIGERYELLQM